MARRAWAYSEASPFVGCDQLRGRPHEVRGVAVRALYAPGQVRQGDPGEQVILVPVCLASRRERPFGGGLSSRRMFFIRRAATIANPTAKSVRTKPPWMDPESASRAT
ncbi:MAG: hypothetical protein M3N18_07810 [Actinomycetota bacterium]|nr:hypothetical protein [Actinomycetota bacterium]